MKKLWKAIATWLRADATLVSLTTHAVGDFRIYRRNPEATIKVPSLTFLCDPALGMNSVAGVKKIPLIFTILNTTAVNTDDIASRLEVLLNPNTDIGQRRGADITNTEIRNLSLVLVNRGDCLYNSNLKVFTADVQASCVYHLK